MVSNFSRTTTVAPASAAMIAAGRPAQPDPTITTSASWSHVSGTNALAHGAHSPAGGQVGAGAAVSPGAGVAGGAQLANAPTPATAAAPFTKSFRDSFLGASSSFAILSSFMAWLRDTVLSLLCSLLNFDPPLCNLAQLLPNLHYYKPESFLCQVLGISHVKCHKEVAKVVKCPGLSEAAGNDSSPVFFNVLLHFCCFTQTVPAPAGALSAQGPPKALHECLFILAGWPGYARPR